MPANILDAARALRARELSSEELLRAAHGVADQVDERLHLYIERFDETALGAAKEADADFKRGVDRGPLQGIPIGVKDIIFTEEAPTTGGSEVKNPAWEVRRDATVVAKLRKAGAVITGKLTTVEFAIGVADPNKPLTMVGNPWNPDHWAGSSSSGSAASVGANAVLAALGTDTGGSVRHPAAYCGVTGLKPTFGRVSKAGVIPLGTSLDCVGPLAHTAGDCAALLQVMAGNDPCDTNTTAVPVPNYSEALGQPISGLRVGVERKNHLGHELADAGLDQTFEEAVAELKGMGATLKDVEFDNFQAVTDAVFVSIYGEALAYHKHMLETQWDSYAHPTRMGIISGALFNAGDYVIAQKVRHAARRRTAELFEEVDVIVTPTGLKESPKFEGLDLISHIETVRTPFWNGLGNPAISVPMGFGQGQLPLGLQIAGRPFDEKTVLRVADAFQRQTDWHSQQPPPITGGTD